MMKICRRQTPLSPSSVAMDSPHPQRRKRGGVMKVAKEAGEAERRGGGKKDVLNMKIFIPVVTKTSVWKTLSLQNNGYAIEEDSLFISLR